MALFANPALLAPIAPDDYPAIRRLQGEWRKLLDADLFRLDALYAEIIQTAGELLDPPQPKKLNIRTGAGENYSVVGTLEQGTTVKEISTKGNWSEIEAPADAFAFVAATFVRQDASAATVPEVVSIQPPDATSSAVMTDPLLASTTTDVANTNPIVEPNPTPLADVAGAAAPPPMIEEVWVPRTVSHEGVVKPTVSIQAPTKFGLHSKENGKLINYLYSPTAALEMSRYVGLHIIVSGQEGLDERWVNTPVLTIQKIYVVK